MDQLSSHSRNRRIVLVDDDATILFALEDYFQSCGWNVAAATSRAEALELLRSDRPDVVVTDLRLGSDADGGLRLIAELDGQVDHVVLLTAFSSPEVVAEARRLGAAAVLPKRLPLEEVEKLFRKLLDDDRAPLADGPETAVLSPDGDHAAADPRPPRGTGREHRK